jgi:hypothetical protein
MTTLREHSPSLSLPMSHHYQLSLSPAFLAALAEALVPFPASFTLLDLGLGLGFRFAFDSSIRNRVLFLFIYPMLDLQPNRSSGTIDGFRIY